MKIELPPIGDAMRQDSTWNPARLVCWLVVDRGRLVVRIRQLEEEVERLRQRERRASRFAL